MTVRARREVHAHVALDDGRAFTVAVARFSDLSWASIVDVQRRRCWTAVIGAPGLPARLRESGARRHPLVQRALDEVLAEERLPYPDVLGEPAEVRPSVLRLDVAGVRCDLALASDHVEGTLTIDGVVHAARGVGIHFESAELTDVRAVVFLADGRVVHASGGMLVPLAAWTSRHTFHDFAVAWRLVVPDERIDVELRASFDEQEVVTMTAGAPLWRGRCEVTGGGVAFVEQTTPMTELFATIPRETRRAIQKELPLPLTHDGVLAVLGGDLGPYVRDFDPAEFQRIVIEPIREVVDRMGKAWRSYSAVMCYHALRGDAFRRDCIDALLSLTEVIHVGSLIVDDVQDSSPTRRGGPSAHVAHGVPLAINAGTFCYFAWQAWFARLGLPDAARLQIYERYFEFMRLAHLGQALDIQGFTPRMTDEIVSTGEVELLTRQMHNVYVFKTGAPASIFARIGAIVAGGSDAAVRAIGELFEALGIAFQIMDDVQNLKGFVGDPKHCEDLAQAKVTMPVLEAMRLLDQRERSDLWARILRCGAEPALVPGILATLDACGAFGACRDHAERLIEEAWRGVTPLLEDSIAKVMLRSFCFYVVECLG